MLIGYTEGREKSAPALLVAAGGAAHRKDLDMHLQSTTLPAVSGVYAIRNTVTGKMYVGSAVNMRRRELAHRRQLLTGRHTNSYLQQAWNKYGAGAFTFAVLTLVPDVALLTSEEQHWLDATRAADPAVGYNLSPTAYSILGYRFTPEQKAHVSAGAKGKPKSAEARAALSQARRGQAWCIAAARKAGAGNKGNRQQPEHRAKRSAAQCGMKNHRAALSDAQVDEIRSALAAGERGRDLARRFGVSEGHISDIKHGKKRAMLT